MNCKRLEKIVLGKGADIKLHSIGKKAFAENEHLREIYFAGRNLRKVYPATFEGIRKTIKIRKIIRKRTRTKIQQKTDNGILGSRAGDGNFYASVPSSFTYKRHV